MWDLSGIEVTKEFEVLPDGEYKVQCTDVNLKDTKSGSGKYIATTFEVISPGTGLGRKIFMNFNVANPNAKAVEIGLKQLKSFLQAAKVQNADKLENVDSLLGLQCMVKTKIKKDAEFGDRAEIHYFMEPKNKEPEFKDLPF